MAIALIVMGLGVVAFVVAVMWAALVKRIDDVECRALDCLIRISAMQDTVEDIADVAKVLEDRNKANEMRITAVDNALAKQRVAKCNICGQLDFVKEMERDYEVFVHATCRAKDKAYDRRKGKK